MLPNFEGCYECGSCIDICPRHALEFEDNDFGEYQPRLNIDLCSHCGLCEKVCPALHTPILNKPLYSYAARSNNSDDTEHCASGGVVTAVSRMIIGNGGIVFGVILDDKPEPVYATAENEAELDGFRNSKYVQAYTKGVFTAVSKELKRDRAVLFVGTPCRVAGLKSFLGREYDKLITIDLICHGTPPAKFLSEYLSSGIFHGMIDNVSFRNSKGFYITASSNGKIIYEQPQTLDYYLFSYIKGFIYRERCYSCPFAAAARCGDLSCGDFWGLDRTTLIKKYDGKVSLVLANTKNGETVLANCNTSLITEERSINEAVTGNGQLQNPMRRSKDHEIFRQKYPRYGFLRAVKKTPSGKQLTRIRYRHVLLSPVKILLHSLFNIGERHKRSE